MNYKHGMSKHPIYITWRSMLGRCYNTTNGSYRYYGKKGIMVCDRWEVFENFRDDMLPSWKPALSLDRIDNNADYEHSSEPQSPSDARG